VAESCEILAQSTDKDHTQCSIMVRAARKAGLGVPDFLFAIGLATLEILELETRLGAWNQTRCDDQSEKWLGDPRGRGEQEAHAADQVAHPHDSAGQGEDVLERVYKSLHKQRRESREERCMNLVDG